MVCVTNISPGEHKYESQIFVKVWPSILTVNAESKTFQRRATAVFNFKEGTTHSIRIVY